MNRRDLREIFASTWAPAHLSGWWTPSGPLEEDDDPFADRQDGTSPEVEALLEAEEEGADAIDEAFVAAWQKTAEEERESRARQANRAELTARVNKTVSWPR